MFPTTILSSRIKISDGFRGSQSDCPNERPSTSARGKELIAGILLVALIATLGIRNLVPADALGARDRHPAVCGWRNDGRLRAALPARPLRIMWFDLAGSLTFIGVVLSVLIERDEMVRLFALSNQPE